MWVVCAPALQVHARPRPCAGAADKERVAFQKHAWILTQCFTHFLLH